MINIKSIIIFQSLYKKSFTRIFKEYTYIFHLNIVFFFQIHETFSNDIDSLSLGIFIICMQDAKRNVFSFTYHFQY